MSNDDMNANTARIRVYHPQGFQVYIEIMFDDASYAMREVDAIAAAGWLPSPPDLPEGGEKEKIVTVMRRAKGDGTPIIDFYPEWNAAGTFGFNKYGHLYLDSPEDIAQFEAQSGLRLADLPVFDSDRPLKRTSGKKHQCEVSVRTPFELVRIPDGQYDSGMPKYQYQYAIEKHVNADAPAPQPKQSRKQTATAWYEDDNNYKLLTAKLAECDPSLTIDYAELILKKSRKEFKTGALFYDAAVNEFMKTRRPVQNPLYNNTDKKQPNQYDKE